MKKTLLIILFTTLMSGFIISQSLVQTFDAPNYSYGLTHDGTNLWVGSSNGYEIWKLDEDGNVLGSISAATDETRGLGWDGSNLWGYQYVFGSSAGKEDMIVKYDESGNPLLTWGSPFEDYIGGMCYALDHIWISVYYTGSGNPAYIIKIDPATGEFVDTLAAPGLQPQGLAFDGHSLWCAMDDNDGDPEKIWEIDPNTGEFLSSFDIPPYGSTTTARPKDLAYNNGYLYLVVGISTNMAIYKFDLGGNGTPEIQLSTDEINFPLTTSGTTETIGFTAYNVGDADLAISSVDVSGTTFAVADETYPVVIEPNGNFTFDVEFTPSAYGNFNGVVTVNSDDPLHLAETITLAGTGVLPGPTVSVSPPSGSFGDVWVALEGVAHINAELLNKGDETLIITGMEMNHPAFTVNAPDFPINIAPNTSVAFNMAFTPPMAGMYDDTLVVTSNDVNSPSEYIYTGNGIVEDYTYGYKFWDFMVPDNPNYSVQDYRVEGLKPINDITGDGIPEVIAATDNYWLLCLDGAAANNGYILWALDMVFGSANQGSIGMTFEYGVQDAMQIHPDVNGDGKNDIIVGTGGANEHVYAIDGTNGDIIWGFGNDFTYGLGDFGAVDAQRDFNGDGVNDVLAVASGNEEGTGYHRAYLFNGTDGEIVWSYYYPGPNEAFGKSVISIADVTNDDVPDAVIAVGNNGSTQLLTICLDGANGSQVWSQEAGSWEPKELLEYPVAGETPDVISAEYFGRIYRYDGESGTVRWTYFLGSQAGIIQMDIINDVNGDGHADVLIAAFTGGVTCVSGSDGAYLWSYGMAYQFGVAAVPDLNGDGIEDVITGDNNGIAYCIDGTGQELLFSYQFADDNINSVNFMPSIDGNPSSELIVGTREGKIACFSGGTQAVSQGWQNEIFITDAAGNKADGTLYFGQKPGATDGLDALYNELELPPVPPAGVFDIRFILPTTPQLATLTDYRSSSETSAIWELKFQPGDAGYPVTLGWLPTALPGGSFRLVDPFGGVLVDVDMKSTDMVEITNTAVNNLLIEYTSEVSSTFNVNAGWNLISIPLLASDMSVTTIFPDAISDAFAFDAGYTAVTEFQPGEGYWLKFSQADAINITGEEVTEAVQLQAGWNLKAPYNMEVTVADIMTNPDGIITSDIFGFNSGYFAATSIEPGKGYWLKTSSAGEMYYPLPVGKKNPIVGRTNGLEFPALTITDATGNISTLYLDNSGSDLSHYEMPPMPPAGVFDVRFGNNCYVENISNESVIKLSSVNAPFRIASNGMDLQIAYTINGKRYEQVIAEGRELVIPDNGVSELSVLGEAIPTEFSLEQNYPNPFNPSTTIKFTLPEASKVVLDVYNVLGEKVASLIDANLESGYHEVKFNAESGISTGVYIYRIQAGDFTQTKKMMLVK